MNKGQFEDAIRVADEVLRHYPKFAYAMVKKGTAYYHLIRTEFMEKYASERDIPQRFRSRLERLYENNQRAFADAEALGWLPPRN